MTKDTKTNEDTPSEYVRGYEQGVKVDRKKLGIAWIRQGINLYKGFSFEEFCEHLGLKESES
jgi:hypothetical protein